MDEKKGIFSNALRFLSLGGSDAPPTAAGAALPGAVVLRRPQQRSQAAGAAPALVDADAVSGKSRDVISSSLAPQSASSLPPA